MNEVTSILDRVQQGGSRAADELIPLVYEELRRLAAMKMAREQSGQTLQPTALVHEAYLRLLGQEKQAWQNSRHFFSAAAEAMRRILVERARHKARQRHGGELHLSTLMLGEMESRAGIAPVPQPRDGFANRRLSCSANGMNRLETLGVSRRHVPVHVLLVGEIELDRGDERTADPQD